MGVRDLCAAPWTAVTYSEIVRANVPGGQAVATGRQFHGLFVGINRYQARRVRRLASAVRDATALHAIFSDNLGGHSALIVDAAATRSAIVTALEDLRHRTTPDDVVVVAFSGHGSDTHQLVTHDADPYNLPSTSLPLDEFTDLVSAIPARQLIVILDCCFSGGAGAKVLNAPLAPRGGAGGLPASTDARLEKMAGVGRLILAASTGDQEAWEDPRLGHGLLTYHLLQGLLGSAAAGGHQVALYDLLAYVVREVRAKASGTVAARQEPSLRGQVDGELVWPVFTSTGPLYSALYPSSAVAPVTEDLASLRGHGVPQPVLDAWSTRIQKLNPLQIATINEGGLLAGHNLLVTAPTSSGKTMVGELAAIRAAQVGARSVFLLPTRALVNEQYGKFSATYGPLGLQTIRATGETSDDVPALLQGQFDLAVLTYEKFAGLALGNAHLLRMLSVVVIDEVQTIVDRGRGAYLEFLLTLLKVRRSAGVAPQIVALSAVLGDLGGLDSWLDAAVIRRTERPVPLLEGVLGPDGMHRHLAADGSEATEQLIPATGWVSRNRELIIPLVTKLVGDGQQVIVFRSTRPATRLCAGYLAEALGLPPAKAALDSLASADPSVVLSDLRRCLTGGVAFHISDLARDEKIVLEEQFRAPGSQMPRPGVHHDTRAGGQPTRGDRHHHRTGSPWCGRDDNAVHRRRVQEHRRACGTARADHQRALDPDRRRRCRRAAPVGPLRRGIARRPPLATAGCPAGPLHARAAGRGGRRAPRRRRASDRGRCPGVPGQQFRRPSAPAGRRG
jgi:hypothetical protein